MKYLGTYAELPQGPVLVKASLGALLGPSCGHSGPAEAATNWIALYLEAGGPGSVQQAPGIGWHQSPPQEAPAPTHLVGQLQTASEQIH